MIKKQVKYKGRVIFEKVIVPRFERLPKSSLSDEACIMFLDGGTFTIRSSNQIVKINEESMLIAKCMNYFFELPAEKGQSDTVQAVGVMLYPSMITELLDLSIIKDSATSSVNQRSIDVNPLLISFKESISYLIDHPQLADEAMIELKLRELILLILKEEVGTSINDFFAHLFDPVIYNLEQSIQQNIFSNLSIDELAFLNNMSKSTFKRKFKNIYAQSPQKYITAAKIERSQHLLKTTNLSITEIADSCGFDGISTFNRNFKNIVGDSPSNYRQSLRD